jgi:hypothetical protein
MEDVLQCDKPIRQAIEIFSKCADHVYTSTVCQLLHLLVQYTYKSTQDKLPVNKAALRERLIQVQDCLLEAGALLKTTVEAHLTAKNLQKIQDIAEYGKAEVLMKILLDPTLEEEVQLLINAGEHYSQFHFY